MPELNFEIERAEMLPYAATPQLAFKLLVMRDPLADEPPVAIHSIALDCQIRIEAAQRTYDDATRERLLELFGPPDQWRRSLKGMLWEHVKATVPSFDECVEIDLRVPCTFDFNVAATKYFDALPEGEVPLTFLFSGTVFYSHTGGNVQVAQIPWEKEAAFRLPVVVWRETIEHYYPGTAWLCLPKEAFDQLHAYKRSHGLGTWERTIDRLLAAAQEEATP